MTPSEPPPIRVPRAWWRLALCGEFVLVFAVVALSGPGRIDIVDGQTRYEVAHSVVEHGDSRIRDEYVWLHVYPGRDGDLYTNYRFPQSAAAVAAILLADATGPVSELRRQFFFTLTPAFACALLAVAYAVFFRRRGLGPRASVAWSLLGIFCTPSWFYGTSTFDDILGTAGLVWAFTFALGGRERRPLLGAVLTGLAMAWVVNCKQPLGLFVLPVLIAGHCPALTPRRQRLRVGIVLGGLLLGVIAYKAYDLYKFPPGSADQDAEYVRMAGAMWTANPIPGLFGLALSPSACVFLYCPTLVLSIIGWRQWRRDDPRLCGSILLASAGFTLFVCFLTFFKGDPAWGPRYLTPIFAVWWFFVPAALARVRLPVAKKLLAAGALVQVLALSVDPQQLFLEIPCPFNYYTVAPWLGFHPSLSHLLQRPREIAEIIARRERAPRYSPAPYATYATRLPPVAPHVAAGVVGMMALHEGISPVVTPPVAIETGMATQLGLTFPKAVQEYHAFASWRPWLLSQPYLAPEDRPVDLAWTAALLLGAALGGLGLVIAGMRHSQGCVAGAEVLRIPGMAPQTPQAVPGASEYLSPGHVA